MIQFTWFILGLLLLMLGVIPRVGYRLSHAWPWLTDPLCGGVRCTGWMYKGCCTAVTSHPSCHLSTSGAELLSAMTRWSQYNMYYGLLAVRVSEADWVVTVSVSVYTLLRGHSSTSLPLVTNALLYWQCTGPAQAYHHTRHYNANKGETCKTIRLTLKLLLIFKPKA